ncbi:MAG: DNA alkylation repair protein [Anaerosomatales bacterium]|nr:DNA alkylation repair protein [Anaerosomatales bacterium]MDT8433687.1 DNA alkylation repair protein [Anaerosomatales bacterium]
MTSARSDAKRSGGTGTTTGGGTRLPAACGQAESTRDEEFVKRAGFVLIATLAVHAKDEPASRFAALLRLIPEGAADERPMVSKGANWALRQVGKRGGSLHGQALAVAEELSHCPARSTRRVGSDALRELRKRT